MTRDEAIAYGNEQLEIFGGTHREFIRMAIEALERPHGEWIIQNGMIVCSECFEPNFETNYCPNCGAEMRDSND